MIKKLTIENFRGFGKFECDWFAPVTVIGGRNNSGKSSLLESIAAVCDFSSSEVLVGLNETRGLKIRTLDDFNSLFFDGDRNHKISIRAEFSDDVMRTTEIDYIRPTVVVREVIAGGGTDVNDVAEAISGRERIEVRVRAVGNREADWNFEKVLSCFRQGEGAIAHTANDNAHSVIGTYVSPLRIWSADELLVRLYLENNMDSINAVLKSVDDRIEEISPVNDKIFAKVRGCANRISINALGDGMRKIAAALAIVMTTCRGGVVAIDEIENGLHYTAMRPFWSALVGAARDRDIQLIVTTHNLEMMKSVSAALPEPTGDSDFKYARLSSRKDGGIAAAVFDAESFKAHIEEDLELR